MGSILVVGGTGYAGSAIVEEAAERGHEVSIVSRSKASLERRGATYLQGPAETVGADAVEGHDTVVLALSPRGDTAGTVLSMYRAIAERARAAGARLVVVGGFSSLRPAEDAPRFADGDLDPALAGEAREMDGVRAWLEEDAGDDLDWLFVSPAMTFHAGNPGTATGDYRVSGPVAILEEDGTSSVSGADFAKAVVDEIEEPRHRGHIGVVG